jgi:3-hydroxyisobutyrate dehydrogenase-like beta-hydroxyacid dehydrogenase
MTATTAAFIGLGVMGFPMAGHLAQAGHAVRVYNRTRSKAERWVETHGGTACDTPAEAASGADIAFTCVGNDSDLEMVTLGEDGALAGLASGGLLVDHTTASAESARMLARQASDRGIGFLDAPVSGGQAGAEQGRLTVMVGGSEAAFAQAEPLMSCYGRAVTRVGEVGSGQLCKMVNQICITGLLQGLSEGLNFGLEAGLDMEKVIDVISQGAAQSWQMDNRARTMIEGKFDFGFAVEWMRKDLDICLAESRRNGARLPVTALVDQFYAEVQALGGNRYDTSSLIVPLFRDRAGPG